MKNNYSLSNLPDVAKFLVRTTENIWMEVTFEDWYLCPHKGLLIDLIPEDKNDTGLKPVEKDEK